MRKLLVALPLVVATSIGFTAAPASADVSGRMNSTEYNWIDTTIPGQNTRAEVQNHCDCTGIKIWDGVRGDNDAIGIRYDTPSGADAYVYYVIRDDGFKYAYAKDWCDDSGCHEGDI